MQSESELKSWRKRTKLLMSAVLTRQPLKGCRLDPVQLKCASSLRKCAKPLFKPLNPQIKKKIKGQFGAFFWSFSLSFLL